MEEKKFRKARIPAGDLLPVGEEETKLFRRKLGDELKRAEDMGAEYLSGAIRRVLDGLRSEGKLALLAKAGRRLCHQYREYPLTAEDMGLTAGELAYNVERAYTVALLQERSSEDLSSEQDRLMVERDRVAREGIALERVTRLSMEGSEKSLRVSQLAEEGLASKTTALTAAEEERQRLAAEAERKRLEAEAESQRLAAEEELKRFEAEAERLVRRAKEADLQRLEYEDLKRIAAQKELDHRAKEADLQGLAAEEDLDRRAAEAERDRLALEAEVASERERFAREDAKFERKAEELRKSLESDIHFESSSPPQATSSGPSASPSALPSGSTATSPPVTPSSSSVSGIPPPRSSEINYNPFSERLRSRDELKRSFEDYHASLRDHKRRVEERFDRMEEMLHQIFNKLNEK